MFVRIDSDVTWIEAADRNIFKGALKDRNNHMSLQGKIKSLLRVLVVIRLFLLLVNK